MKALNDEEMLTVRKWVGTKISLEKECPWTKVQIFAYAELHKALNQMKSMAQHLIYKINIFDIYI